MSFDTPSTLSPLPNHAKTLAEDASGEIEDDRLHSPGRIVLAMSAAGALTAGMTLAGFGLHLGASESNILTRLDTLKITQLDSKNLGYFSTPISKGNENSEGFLSALPAMPSIVEPSTQSPNEVNGRAKEDDLTQRMAALRKILQSLTSEIDTLTSNTSTISTGSTRNVAPMDSTKQLRLTHVVERAEHISKEINALRASRHSIRATRQQATPTVSSHKLDELQVLRQFRLNAKSTTDDIAIRKRDLLWTPADHVALLLRRLDASQATTQAQILLATAETQ